MMRPPAQIDTTRYKYRKSSFSTEAGWVKVAVPVAVPVKGAVRVGMCPDNGTHPIYNVSMSWIAYHPRMKFTPINQYGTLSTFVELSNNP